MSNEIDHDHMDTIVCPYCGESCSDDDYDYAESNDDQYCCDECEKDFLVSAEHEIYYTTRKTPCEDLRRNHVFGEPSRIDLDQECCDNWNRENFCNRIDHKPTSIWEKYCTLCDRKKSIRTGFKEQVPEGFND